MATTRSSLVRLLSCQEGFVPVLYEDVRIPFNAARLMVASISVAIILALATIGGMPRGWLVVPLALAMTADAAVRLYRPGRSALAPLLLDATLVGLALQFFDATPALLAAPLVYFLAASYTLLPLPAVLLSTGYLGAGSLVLLPHAEMEIRLWMLGLLAVLFFAVQTASLSRVTIRSLRQGAERKREALDMERRAGQMKDQFVAMVSHELRTPLTSISGFAHLLQESWAELETEELAEFLGTIVEQTDHITQVVEDILIIPRLDSGRLQLDLRSIPVREVALATAEMVFGADLHRQVTVAVPEELTIWADRDRLQQVLRNLFENALKYGGDEVLVEATCSADAWVLSVSDNGPGVAQQLRERIFEPFEQAGTGHNRQTGLGLGLPIARRLARAMGGDLWLEERFPSGCRFSVRLPIPAAGLEPSPVGLSA